MLRGKPRHFSVRWLTGLAAAAALVAALGAVPPGARADEEFRREYVDLFAGGDGGALRPGLPAARASGDPAVRREASLRLRVDLFESLEFGQAVPVRFNLFPGV